MAYGINCRNIVRWFM